MPEVVFVMSAQQPDSLRELAETLKYELELQAVPSDVHIGRFPTGTPRTVPVLLDPREYVRLEGEQALPGAAVLRRTIFLCAGAPPAVDDEADIDLLRRAGSVFALDQPSVAAMHRRRVYARLLRPGYSKFLDRFDPDADRPIDVMFLGAHSLRRTKYLSQAAGVLSRHNCRLQISEPEPSPAGSSSPEAEMRWQFLAQTKVVINLHRGDDAGLEWRRTLDAIHAGAVVVTEHASGIAPLAAGEHLLVAGPEAVPYVADALLQDPERLATVRAAAYERLRSWVPYALWVSVLRAAVVELVGEAVPPEWTSPAPEPELGGRPVSQPESADGRHRSLPPPARAGAGCRVDMVSATPAWRVGRVPRLSVLMALPPGCAGLEATLNSLVHSRLQDFELVVVDAGADDRVLGLTTEWIGARPRIAACLLRPSVDRGLGAAWNVALDFARGPACLILDPGHELYSRSLGVLTGTLEATAEAAFVYPIQEVTGEPEAFAAAGGDYLLSFLGWSRQRLRQSNPVHTPALVRTRHLREMGGFATDVRLAGLEDYDLWCRLAEHGWRGQLVPQILARRPESGSSPALSAIHPSGPGLAALSERSPNVVPAA